MISSNSMLSSFQLDPVLSIRASREYDSVRNFIGSAHICIHITLVENHPSVNEDRLAYNPDET